jgi:hypothetical protein
MHSFVAYHFLMAKKILFLSNGKIHRNSEYFSGERFGKLRRFQKDFSIHKCNI